MIVQRFYIKSNYGHWSVMDRATGKMVVGYSKKSGAEVTAAGLNRLKKPESISKMIEKLRTEKGYGHYIRLNKLV